MKLLSHDRTFVGDEFIAQLNVLVFFAAIQYIGVFCDSVISGQLLGEAALAGIMLVNSLIAFGSFISILPVAGSVVLVNVISGLADNDRVEKAYSQGLIMTVVMGGALSIIYVYLRGHLTMFISGSGEPLFYANQYFHFILKKQNEYLRNQLNRICNRLSRAYNNRIWVKSLLFIWLDGSLFFYIVVYSFAFWIIGKRKMK